MYDWGACIGEGEDNMQWEGPKKLDIQNSMIYIIIFHWQKKTFKYSSWFKAAWRLEIPKKHICFGWLAIHKRVLTWDKLQGKCFQGLSICSMFRMQDEEVDHLFIGCSFPREMWIGVMDLLKLDRLGALHTLEN